MKTKPVDHCPICSTQEEKITEEILGLMQKKSFPKGSLVFSPQENSQGLYLITQGTVKISKLSPQGKEVVLGILGTGKTFGEASALGLQRHEDTATATENSEVFLLPSTDLQRLTQQYPLFYQSVVSALVRWMANLNQVIESITLSSARDRVWAHLQRLQADQGGKQVIQLQGKKHEVALMLGLRPETFSRTLSDLETEGLIKMNHKQIQIL